MVNVKEIQPAPEKVADNQWKEFRQKAPEGIWWPAEAPTGEVGITIKTNSTYFRFFPIIDSDDLEEAFWEARSLHEVLTDPEILRVVPLVRHTLKDYLQEVLKQYSKPRGERRAI